MVELCRVHFGKPKKNNGKYNIIGRSVVIHDKADDLGKGGDEESLGSVRLD